MTVPMSDDVAAKFRQEFEATWERSRHKPVKLLTPLPRRVRLRLWLERRVNHAGIWLAGHGHWKAAERLWRVCGMW
jgi:hypothetical protein